MKKFFIFLLFILFSAGYVFCQETEETDISDEKNYVDEKDMTVSEVEELLQSGGFINRIDFVFGIAPILSINSHTKNSDGKFISAPSPIAMDIYFGLSVPNYTPISFQPSLRVFNSYSLVYNDMVLPAEIENRTGQTLSFLLNLPVVFKLNYKNRCSWSVFGGLAGLFRYSILPANVKETEPGFTGTVRSDIDYMNKWHYKNLRFLYVSTGIDWLFYYGTTKYGPELAVFFPISVFSDKSIDGLMISVGIKVEF